MNIKNLIGQLANPGVYRCMCVCICGVFRKLSKVQRYVQKKIQKIWMKKLKKKKTRWMRQRLD